LKVVPRREGGPAAAVVFEKQPTPGQIRALARRHKAFARDCVVFPITDDNRERLLARAKWSGWRRKIRAKGLDLVVVLQDSIENGRFALVFRDAREGEYVKSVARNLNALSDADFSRIAARIAKAAPVGPCARCGRAALGRTCVVPRGPELCRKCFLIGLKDYAKEEKKRLARELAAKLERLKRKGFRYLAQVWIHPKAGGDDWYVEESFKTKPTESALRGIARRHDSAVLGDHRVVAAE